MAISNNPLAPDPITDIDSTEVWTPIRPQEDLTKRVLVGEEEDSELKKEDDSVDKDDPL